MKYLALDNALVTTGGCIYEGRKLIKYDKFTIGANKKIEQRLGQIGGYLSELYHDYEFDMLFFEDCQSQNNAQTYQKLSMVKATILLGCYFNEMPYQILSPSHGRKILKTEYGFSFGKSRAEQKNKAKEIVKQYYHLTPTEDECDAICLGLAGITEYEKTKSAF